MGTNVSKNRLFGADERIAMMRRACDDLPNVSVEGFAGLVTTFCAEHDATAIVKGLRAASDFDYELQMAQMNSSLTGVETVFHRPTGLLVHLVKEVAASAVTSRSSRRGPRGARRLRRRVGAK